METVDEAIEQDYRSLEDNMLSTIEDLTDLI